MKCPGLRSRTLVPHLNEQELLRREIALKQKEKELLQKETQIQKKLTKIKKRKSNKAKADLEAAAKLKRAKKSLILALDTRDTTIKERSIKKHKPKKINIRKKNDMPMKHAKSLKKKSNSVPKLPMWENPLPYLYNLFNKPCKCLPQSRKKSGKKEPASYLQSCLQQIIGRPCSCKNAELTRSAGSPLMCYNPCRCGEENSLPKQTAWEKAAGDCYMMSLRRPPQPLIFRFPRLYHRNNDLKTQCKNFGYALLCLASALYWIPCLVLCKCCFCSCCTDG